MEFWIGPRYHLAVDYMVPTVQAFVYNFEIGCQKIISSNYSQVHI